MRKLSIVFSLCLSLIFYPVVSYAILPILVVQIGLGVLVSAGAATLIWSNNSNDDSVSIKPERLTEEQSLCMIDGDCGTPSDKRYSYSFTDPFHGFGFISGAPDTSMSNACKDGAVDALVLAAQPNGQYKYQVTYETVSNYNCKIKFYKRCIDAIPNECEAGKLANDFGGVIVAPLTRLYDCPPGMIQLPSTSSCTSDFLKDPGTIAMNTEGDFFINDLPPSINLASPKILEIPSIQNSLGDAKVEIQSNSGGFMIVESNHGVSVVKNDGTTTQAEVQHATQVNSDGSISDTIQNVIYDDGTNPIEGDNIGGVFLGTGDGDGGNGEGEGETGTEGGFTTFNDEVKAALIYESKYPDGMTGIWDDHRGSFETSTIGSYIADWEWVAGGGQEPSFTFDFDFGIAGNFGTHTLSFPLGILPFARLALIIGSLVYARKLVLGG